MMMEVACLPVTELPKMLKNLTHGTVPTTVNYSYLPCLHHCGFHAWIDCCLMHGQEPDAGSYLGGVVDCWTEHVTDLTNANEDKDNVKTPPSLMNHLIGRPTVNSGLTSWLSIATPQLECPSPMYCMSQLMSPLQILSHH